MENNENFLESCLFFNTNTLSRYLLKIAEKEFKHLNLSPAHASMLLLVYDTPGISPKELSCRLNLTPSTITRFVDALEKKGLVSRKAKGKAAFISASKKGLELKSPVAVAYKNLYLKYTKILGSDSANKLSFTIYSVNKKLSQFIANGE
ncbi:MAG: MarR family transcriptional regulator [Desulfobacula sp.]|jgi:DNA-binding MarR family transcriptional regulator|uniref:MarR family winged helix-turn-helix transcriptional regulator n=1 Tax=Desulfobacula sp. TaxID=2593537 RepID=UPI001DF78D44|nr:MarR family transcriptional regulator [Desulfobacula sp.]MBT3484426.1 MarR family transcriptional regulator [Desulfobacula sp.]MBT3803341.1 MarR family transcriptional regulator [Desulfobacula sp.]MBT4023692.1 MarR family transcriptional regulator [Desulfobacula sp.]MBT4197934.1 MarR family transcriptional regulator [Desulfobacula sp.]